MKANPQRWGWRSSFDRHDLGLAVDLDRLRQLEGGFAWRGWSLSRKRALAARELTSPALTARYVELIDSARQYYNGKMVIAIDELDKIHDPEAVKALLAEIKARCSLGCSEGKLWPSEGSRGRR